MPGDRTKMRGVEADDSLKKADRSAVWRRGGESNKPLSLQVT